LEDKEMKQNLQVEGLVQNWLKAGVLNGKEIKKSTVELERKIAKRVLRMIDLKIINEDETLPARSLTRSARFRIQSAKDKSKPDHYGAYCDWDNEFSFAVDVIRYKKDMWKDWKQQEHIFLATANKEKATSTEIRNAIPTIDRIDSDKEIGYRLENIQCLSKYDNDRKASSTPCKVLIIKDREIKGAFEFGSKKELVHNLVNEGIPINATQIKFDTGIIQEVGNGFSILLQSKNGEVPTADEALYQVIINHRRELIDEDTGDVIKTLGHWQYQFEAGALRI
jgi:hypothetical protein